MGLATVYSVIHRHHGDIRVESEPGNGACFCILLPLTAAEAPASVPASSKLALRINAHIMLVDDEELIRDTARQILEKLGCKVTVRSNGREAVDTFRQNPDAYDLVILDMIMPVMKADEAYLAMCAIRPDVRVLLVSGYSQEGEARKLLEAGVQDFLQKPFTIANLTEKVVLLLRKKNQAVLQKA